MPMITKALADLTRDDLLERLRTPWIEDEQLDFKSTIPHRAAHGHDPWRDARNISDHGRDQVLAAISAFANSYGGDLVIGVREAAESKPGAAEAFEPLPACEDAAQRLAQQATACIEPPLPALQVRAIPLEADGSGVVILRTPQSRMAPHRLTTNKECYHRVRHETRPMTMRQIQDLTLNVSRGLEAVERKLQVAATRFRDWVDQTPLPADNHRVALRFTAVPLSEIYVEHVHNVEALRPALRRARLRLQPNHRDFGLTPPCDVSLWRPTLRASEASRSTGDWHARVTVSCDGMINYEWLRHAPLQEQNGRQHVLYPGWYFALLVNVVEAADRFRSAAGAAAVEYALEIELNATTNLPVLRFPGDRFDPAGNFPGATTHFPRYVIGPSDSLQQIYTQAYRDFWNSIGIDTQQDAFLLDVPLG
jgi:hypothetical protein